MKWKCPQLALLILSFLQLALDVQRRILLTKVKLVLIQRIFSLMAKSSTIRRPINPSIFLAQESEMLQGLNVLAMFTSEIHWFECFIDVEQVDLGIVADIV